MPIPPDRNGYVARRFDSLPDPSIYSCKCFRLEPKDVKRFCQRLVRLGFTEQTTQRRAGTDFDLRLCTEAFQLHVRITPDGVLESTLDPPDDYPFASPKSLPSFPGHDAMDALLDLAEMDDYYALRPPLETCNLKNLLDLYDPPNFWTILVMGMDLAGFGHVLATELKKD